MATKTGSSYTTGTTTDSVEIPTASPGFSTMPRPNKVSPSDCDNERQPEMGVQTFCSPITQFFVVGRCRNHLANLPVWMATCYFRQCRIYFNCTFHVLTDISISSFGRRFRLSFIIGITQLYCLRVCYGRMPQVRVGKLMVYVIVSELSELPVTWLPSWISRTRRRPTKSEMPLLESLTSKTQW